MKNDILLTLKSYRVRKGYRQEELAKLCGISKQALCQVEIGHSRPQIATLVRMCDELSLTQADRSRVFRHFRHRDVDFDDAFFSFRLLRQGKGLTQQQLADMLGVSRGTVFNFERGRGVTPELAVKICVALDVSVEDSAALLEKINEGNGDKEPADGVHAVSEGQ
jgi:transcriptional regulator with XRE-family HTH domain